MATCGDFGGETQAGKPCGRRVIDGPCLFHDESLPDPNAEAKEAALDALRSGKAQSLTDAAHAAGVRRETLWKWRQADPGFDRALQDLLPSDEEFLDQWKGSVKRRALAGELSGTLEIWFIVNLSRKVAQQTGQPVEWQDLRNGVQADMPLDMESLPEEALDRIAAGEDPVRVVAETLREIKRVEALAAEEPQE